MGAALRAGARRDVAAPPPRAGRRRDELPLLRTGCPELARIAIDAAIERGELVEARRLIAHVRTAAGGIAGATRPSADVRQWPDAWLVASVACDPPDEGALGVLVDRHWKALYGRCELLAMDRERARDLAQEAWARVLRARRSLRPNENFVGYLVTVATNIWRDWSRRARRAGGLAEHRLSSLDATAQSPEGDGAPLGELLPDLGTLSFEDRAALRIDLDRALARMTPRSRELLTARYLDGLTAAELGVQHARTEQTITSWLRQAIRELHAVFNQPSDPAPAGANHES